jgi:TctA family transporter
MFDLYNLDAMAEGLRGIMSPDVLLLIFGAVIISSLFAAIPGISSILFLTLCIPYAMGLEPYQCIALMLGIGVVSNTANTFSSVLIAVPGSSGSQATIVDGHPMARNGEARRAFGAAYTASAVGGILGGVVFLISLPVMEPMVLAFGSPEFLMMVLWGVSAVGILSGNAPLKGLMAAVLGLGIALIGTDARTSIERFTFGDYYLWNGVHLVLVALGTFAVPEIIDLSVRRASISGTGSLGSGLGRGVRDVFRNWWLVIRCSAIGVWVGMLPGLGSSVADWFAYAHTVQSEKNKENFGKGDVRGVIGPESSNNAKEGGALIPTMIFGVPGSTSYALMLAAFISVGITPGDQMLGPQLPYLYGMLWVLILANLLATGLSIGFSNTFAKISILPFYIIVPMTLVLCMIASFSASYSYLDLLTLGVFSVIGVFMKRFGWPRPPLLVAVVLGPQLQNYLWLSVDRYGLDWLSRPGVLALLVLILGTMLYPVWRRISTKDSGLHLDLRSEAAPSLKGNITLVTLFMILAVAAVIGAQSWPLKASLDVYVIATAALLLGTMQLALDIRGLLRPPVTTPDSPPVTTPGGTPGARPDSGRRYAEIALWILGLGAAIVIVGFRLSIFVFPIAYARSKGAGWRLAIFLGILSEFILLMIFGVLIHIIWPVPMVLRIF